MPSRGLADGEEHFFDRRVKTPVREQGGPGIVPADIEVVAPQLDSLVGNAHPGPPRLNFGRASEGLDRAGGGVRHARIVPWIVAKEELSSPVIIRGAQVGATGTDCVAAGSACIGDGGYAVCQGTPFPIPRLRVAGRDPFGGGDDLANIGPAVGGVSDRAQCLKRERFVGVEDESHVRSSRSYSNIGLL